MRRATRGPAETDSTVLVQQTATGTSAATLDLQTGDGSAVQGQVNKLVLDSKTLQQAS